MRLDGAPRVPSHKSVNPRLGRGGGGPGAPDCLGAGCLLPHRSSPIALIQKGDWCGSEFIRHLRNENRRRVCGDHAALRGTIKNVSGHEGLGRARTGVS